MNLTFIPGLLQESLREFNINDLLVTVEPDRDIPKLAGRTEPMLITDVCAAQWSEVNRAEAGLAPAGPTTIIRYEGSVLGQVHNTWFEYENASDLRKALGWLLATTAGLSRSLKYFHLEKATLALRRAEREVDVDKAKFVNVWMPAVEEIFYRANGDKHHDCVQRATLLLWRVATRQRRGQAHLGFTL